MFLAETLAERLPAPTPPAGAIAAPASAEQPVFTLLPRHGRRPLGFTGRVLVEVQTRDPSLPVWSDVTLHEVVAHGFVVAIKHHLRLHPPQLRCYATPCDDPDSVIAMLRSHHPLRDLPVDALYLGAAASDDAGRTAAAAACAERLRRSWSAMLAACFLPCHAKGDSP